MNSSPGEVVQTPAERAREKRLRDDPMADVLGPHFISCRRCGNRIKLSPKSTYDPFHWQKHRERCLKKPAGAIKKRRDASVVPYKKPSTPPAPPANSISPPLTTDEEEDDMRGIRTGVKEESPAPERLSPSKQPAPRSTRRSGPIRSSPAPQEPALEPASPAPATPKSTPPPPTPPAIRPLDIAFREYLYRTRRKLTRDVTPPPGEPWYTWDWSQLTMPAWAVASYPDCGDSTRDHDSGDPGAGADTRGE